jgi:hypothetical protein
MEEKQYWKEYILEQNKRRPCKLPSQKKEMVDPTVYMQTLAMRREMRDQKCRNGKTKLRPKTRKNACNRETNEKIRE